MTSWASCSSWEPPRRPDSRRKPAPPNRPGLPDTFCTARPYRKWAGLLVQNRYFWFKMDFWCKAASGIRFRVWGCGPAGGVLSCWFDESVWCFESRGEDGEGDPTPRVRLGEVQLLVQGKHHFAGRCAICGHRPKQLGAVDFARQPGRLRHYLFVEV